MNYSPERKEAVIKQMMPPHTNQSVSSVKKKASARPRTLNGAIRLAVLGRFWLTRSVKAMHGVHEFHSRHSYFGLCEQMNSHKLRGK
jgi:hypothetical protein